MDHKMGYSYALTNLITEKELLSSAPESLGLAKAQVLNTKFDQAAKACITHLKTENGKELLLKLKYNKFNKL